MRPTKSMNSHLQSRCPYCQTPIRAGEHVVMCSCCKMPHHKECWMENGQCTTYGCKGASLPGTGSDMYRRKNMPLIDISFDDSHDQNFWKRNKSRAWKAAALVAILLGSGYCLLNML